MTFQQRGALHHAGFDGGPVGGSIECGSSSSDQGRLATPPGAR
jgi:hypothetical protein